MDMVNYLWGIGAGGVATSELCMRFKTTENNPEPEAGSERCRPDDGS
jgi:hypothetical protein